MAVPSPHGFVVKPILERYALYLALLKKTAGALQQQDLPAVIALEEKSRQVLREIKAQWERLQPLLAGKKVEADAKRDLLQLREAIKRGLTLNRENEAAANSWLRVVGGSLRDLHVGMTAVQAYTASAFDKEISVELEA